MSIIHSIINKYNLFSNKFHISGPSFESGSAFQRSITQGNKLGVILYF